MDRRTRLALALASTSLLGISGPIEYGSQQLSLLDPSARMASLCGGGRKRVAMRVELALAAALVQAQPAAGIRLYEGLGKVHFPISTPNPDAQR
ncbi:MAG: hypothetical protein ACJ8E7_07640, partial [Sphingomicrobium sp.]